MKVLDFNKKKKEKEKKFLDEIKEFEKLCMKKHGFFIHMVPNDDTQSPSGINIHTHGLEYSFNHINFQFVVPVGETLAMQLMHTLVDTIREGATYEPGKKYSEVLENYNVTFIEATECDRKVLRMIFPDKNGNIDEDKIEEPYKQQYDISIKGK